MDMYFIVLVFIIGVIFGSFYNVCIYRIPNKQSIVNPPSHCYRCNTRLKPIDLVPILSWGFLKGKCRYCKEKISPRYTIVEIITGILFTLIYITFEYKFITIYYMFLTSLLIIITFIDLDCYIIPDILVLIGSITALLVNFLGYGIPFIDAIKGSIFTGGGLLVLTLIIEYILKKEVIGGEGIKLFVMIGLFLGTKLSLLTLLLSIYIGGAYGIIFIVYNKIKNKRFNSMIPFGPFISLATVISMLYGNQIIDFYIKTFL
ncbi:prepilin peptidase [[Eubacterium] tenue]|nr:A24 family peptidase [[Eubacterium] tenue]MBC8632286.1 prepilin peptidase [[Eubacterium] tenue]